MKVLLVAAVTWTTVAMPPLPERKPSLCPDYEAIRSKGVVKDLKPIMTESGKYFMLGTVTIDVMGKQKKHGIIMSRNSEGRYCNAIPLSNGMFEKASRRYQSFAV